MPSEAEPSGDGVEGRPNGFPSPDDGEEATGGSDKAVVAAALAATAGDAEELPMAKGGTRPTEKRDADDSLEAREPGRSGEGIAGTLEDAEPVACEGEDGGGGKVAWGYVVGGDVVWKDVPRGEEALAASSIGDGVWLREGGIASRRDD